MSEDFLVVGVSRDPKRIGLDEWEGLLERCRVEVQALVDNGVIVRSLRGHTSALIGSGRAAEQLSGTARREPVLVSTATRLMSCDGEVLKPATLARLGSFPRQVERLGEVVPPFGYCGRDPATEEIVAGTDAVGLRHIYVTHSHGLALVATSSSLLARLIPTDLDEVAWSLYSLIGCLLGSGSMFRSIRKLDPAETVRILNGKATSRVRSNQVPAAVRTGGFYASEEEAVDAGEATLDGLLRSYAEAFPDVCYELSGGLDSRLLLALALRHGQRPLRTLSIGSECSTDLRIARELVRSHSLNGRFVPLSFIDTIDADRLWPGVARTALRHDFAANPLSNYLYEAVAARAPAAVQMTGQAGELARGKYYAGQRERQRYNQADVARLISWRETLNQAVDPSLFSAPFREARHRHLQHASWAYFENQQGSWPTISDHWYVFGRNQRLAGAVYSQWGRDRQMLTPYFHPRFIDWASRLPVRSKRNSQAFVALLERLSPQLAHHPLDSGLTPLQAAGRVPGSRAALLRRDLNRARRKVGQRLRNYRAVPIRSDRLAELAQQALRTQLPSALATIDWLSQETLNRIQEGSHQLDTVSTAFLLNLAGAAELLPQARVHPRRGPAKVGQP